MTDDVLLEVRNLQVSLAARPVLHDVNLTLRRGEAVGLVGETGSGKTMTVRAVTGLLRRIGGRIIEGSIVIKGADMTHADDRTWRRRQGKELALVPQASMSSLNPIQKVRSQLGEAIRLGNPTAPVREEVVRLLEAVRLEPREELLRSRPHELSGGMRQRVMIALALAARPRILVADEPTTALDASVRGEILALLRDLRGDQGLSVLMVSHDLGAIASATDNTVVMYRGRSVEAGPTARLLTTPEHPYTKALLDAQPQRTAPGDRIPTIADLSEPLDTSVAAVRRIGS